MLSARATPASASTWMAPARLESPAATAISTASNRAGPQTKAPIVEGVVHLELLSDRTDTAIGDANLHGVARIDPRRPTEPGVDRHQDLARLHRRLLEPLQQRRREHVVGHHQGERLTADPVTRRQRREPVALPVPPVAHDRHRDAPASAHLEHVAVDQVGSMARDHHHLVESRLPGAGQGTLDQADTPKLDKRLRAGLGAQPRAHTAGEPAGGRSVTIPVMSDAGPRWRTAGYRAGSAVFPLAVRRLWERSRWRP